MAEGTPAAASDSSSAFVHSGRGIVRVDEQGRSLGTGTTSRVETVREERNVSCREARSRLRLLFGGHSKSWISK